MPSVDEKTLTNLLHAACESDMLRWRLAYAEADSVTKYLKPLVGRSRVYPQFLPTQKSGRWSIKNPPMANFSDDCINPACTAHEIGRNKVNADCWSLRDIVVPDPGTVFYHFDWESIEAKLAAAYSGDDDDLATFASGDDIHSKTLLGMFWGLTEESRFAYAKNMSSVRGNLPGTTFVDNESQVLFSSLFELKTRIGGLLSSECEWYTILRSPDDNAGWAGRNCTSSQWKQARQPTGKFGSYVEGRTYPITQAQAWAAWVICGGPPPDWTGGNNWKRVAAKACRYSLAYGTDQRAIHQAKGIDDLARAANLTRKGIEAMALAYLKSKPKLVAWKYRVWDQIMATQEVRTPLGRRKRLFVTEEERARYRKTRRATESCRQGLNHLAQGQVAGMMNRTIIAIKARWPECRLAFQAHDGLTMVFPERVDPWPDLKEIVEKTWDMANGRSVQSVAEYDRVWSDGKKEHLR